MAASSSEIRVWTADGQHKLDADLGANLGKIAAPQIVVTPHDELLVFDPSAPKVFRFRMHLETEGAPMTLLLTEADVRSLLTMPIALEIVEESLRQQGNGELVLHPRRRIKLPDNALLHYMAAGDPFGDISA